MNDPGMARSDPGMPYGIVAIAASAGGITALRRALGGLPDGFAVPGLVAQPLDPRQKAVIAEVLGRRAKMPVGLAREGERADPGAIPAAPPNRHLLVGADGVLTLSNSE